MTEYTKNPNGGYLKPSTYTMGAKFGNVTLTRALIEQLFAAGGDQLVNIKVSEEKAGNFGPYSRVTVNPLTAEQITRVNQAKAGNGVQQPQQHHQQYAAAAAPPPVSAVSPQPNHVQPVAVPQQSHQVYSPPVAPAPVAAAIAPAGQPIAQASTVLEDEVPF